MTQQKQQHWMAQVREWLRKQPVWAIIIEVDAQTGEVRNVRTETVEMAAAVLDGLPSPKSSRHKE